MHKCISLQKVFTLGLRLLLLWFEIIERFAKLEQTQFVCVPTSIHPWMLARTVKLKQGVILNPEFHYFDEDEISAKSSLLKVFLAVRLIHRFTSPFQLRHPGPVLGRFDRFYQIGPRALKGPRASRESVDVL